MLKVPQDLHVFFQIVEKTPNGVIVTDSGNRIVYVNEAFTVLTGYTLKEVCGQNPRILQSGLHEADFYQELWTSLRTSGQWQGEIWNKRKNGETFIEWQHITALRDDDGSVTHYVSIFSDITDRKHKERRLEKQNSRLERLATQDALTGIANRRLFDDMLLHEWEQARQNGHPLALLMIDIDHFKLFNDTYGHLGGDECLRAVANALRRSVRQGFLARYGGEEFALIAPGANAEAALETARLLVEAVRDEGLPHASSTVLNVVTVSIGCAAVSPAAGAVRPAGAVGPRALVARADEALYRAKARGRNRAEL
ncbi:diguanylate cyclase [Paenibacillus athensensis]|uniref:Diguanylate cyclase n=1 Tax=Paenibacillus athensensis TaxID=1967502 RepID=A0A4Y8PSW5_9BACL|nr:GGDEF domain-containing protein [Paenibacillus athensensis]MCD1258592.1 diguanylate cyclase [Paenibacillus athensensis]